MTKASIIEAPWEKCECGGILFTPLISIKRISKLLTGAANDEVVELPMMKCDGCGKVPGFMHKPFVDFPEDMKAKPKPNETIINLDV